MGKNKWKELLRFGRGLIATATATAAQLLQSTNKSQKNPEDTTERDRVENTYVTNNYHKTIIDNRSIEITQQTVVIQQCCQCCQQFHQEGAQDPTTSKCQQLDTCIGFESPFE